MWHCGLIGVISTVSEGICPCYHSLVDYISPIATSALTFRALVPPNKPACHVFPYMSLHPPPVILHVTRPLLDPQLHYVFMSCMYRHRHPKRHLRRTRMPARLSCLLRSCTAAVSKPLLPVLCLADANSHNQRMCRLWRRPHFYRTGCAPATLPASFPLWLLGSAARRRSFVPALRPIPNHLYLLPRRRQFRLIPSAGSPWNCLRASARITGLWNVYALQDNPCSRRRARNAGAHALLMWLPSRLRELFVWGRVTMPGLRTDPNRSSTTRCRLRFRFLFRFRSQYRDGGSWRNRRAVCRVLSSAATHRP